MELRSASLASAGPSTVTILFGEPFKNACVAVYCYDPSGVSGPFQVVNLTPAGFDVQIGSSARPAAYIATGY